MEYVTSPPHAAFCHRLVNGDSLCLLAIHAIERTKCSVVVGKLHAVLSSVVTVIVVLSTECGVWPPRA
jgi:hypothetical protein